MPASGSTSVRGARTYDDIAARLQNRRLRAGMSYREVHRRVLRERRRRRVPELPVYDTVYRCLQPGRTRMDVDLVLDIATALGVPPDRLPDWREACRSVARHGLESATAGAVDVVDLPPRADRIVGRTAELASLVQRSGRPGAVIVISGMAGVGKTTLAVEAAHRLIEAGTVDDAFLVDMQGSVPDRPERTDTAVLAGLLRRLGVPGSVVAAADQAQRVRLLHEVAARPRNGGDGRLLLLLDNAGDDRQLQSWLPIPGTSVIITSRRELRPTPDTGRVELGPLTLDESVELLGRGSDGAVLEPTGAIRLADLVGHLPLALTIMASRIAALPGWTLTDHITQVSDLQRQYRLDPGVEASLMVSYRTATSAQRDLLRLLAIAPVVDIDVPTAAALGGMSQQQCGLLLSQLSASHLLQASRRRHYSLHDLVRVFAAARATEEDAPSARRAALTRLLDYQAARTGEAMARYSPHEVHLQPPTPVVDVGSFADREDATGWLEAEWADLLRGAHGALDHAVEPELARHGIRMSFLLFRYLDLNGLFDEAERLHGRVAAIASGADQARALNYLGVTDWSAGRLERAVERFTSSVESYVAAGDRERERAVLGNLAGVTCALGDFLGAVGYGHRSLAGAVAAEDAVGQAVAHNNLGVAYERLGDLTAAAQHHQRTLELNRDLADRIGEGRALSNLAEIREHQGRPAEARSLHEQALGVAREVHFDLGASDALNHLARLDSQSGRHAEAIRGHEQALEIARRCGHPESEVEVLTDLADSLHRAGRHDQARTSAESALAGARRTGDRHAEQRATTLLAEWESSPTRS